MPEPGCPDFIFSLPNQVKDSTDLVLRQPVIAPEFDLRLEPEFRFSLTRLDMHVHPALLPREEEGSEATLAENGRAQFSVAPNGLRISGERGAEGDERVRCTRMLGGVSISCDHRR